MIGFISEDAAERLIRQLAQPIEHDALVLRDNVSRTIASSEVVPGDILVLSAGAWVVADARLIESRGLAVDESVLTGESIPVDKQAQAVTVTPRLVADRQNIVHRGTVVTGGDGRAVVVCTGSATEFAQSRALIGAVRPLRPPSEEKLAAMGRGLVGACLAAGGIVVALGLLRRQPAAHIVRVAIAVAVSAIPEGLPAISTTALAHGARRLERGNVYVRALPTMEALASVDTICLDKTGTLTQNRMAVAAFQGRGQLHRIAGAETLSGATAQEACAIARAVALCNEARLGEGTGSGTELALLRFAELCGLDPGRLQKDAPILSHRSRDASHRWMATEHNVSGGIQVILKGAPDELLARSTRADGKRGWRRLTPARRAAIAAVNQSLASEGFRVLGVAVRSGPLGHGRLEELDWLGLIALADPVRQEAAQVIGELHEAGIRTVMITGDQGETALAVAKQLNLSRHGMLGIADGAAISALDEPQLGALAERTSIFARVGPADKLRIIRALESRGHRVAMIGDGVNDGPALRAASVGIGLGRQGADIAREVADIVIADDDLRALKLAIARGRATAKGMNLAVRFMLATNIAEMALIIGEAALGGPTETPLELLWLNLGTDVFPALGLALSPHVSERSADQNEPAGPLFDRRTLNAIVIDAVGMAIAPLAVRIAMGKAGSSPSRQRGATFLTVSLAQMAYALRLGATSHGARSAPLTSAVAASGTLLIAPFLLPSLGRVLRLATPHATGWLLAAAAASASSVTAQGP
ncbi:MAG: cation-transporting P-type ATPase [Sphingobium sp.]|nr:MAG: hypothetical protein DI537_32955 [Stutzerimonas stutzeri]